MGIKSRIKAISAEIMRKNVIGLNFLRLRVIISIVQTIGIKNRNIQVINLSTPRFHKLAYAPSKVVPNLNIKNPIINEITIPAISVLRGNFDCFEFMWLL